MVIKQLLLLDSGSLSNTATGYVLLGIYPVLHSGSGMLKMESRDLGQKWRQSELK